MVTNEELVGRDYLVAPGDVLEEYLESYGMTQKELSYRIKITTKHINEIVKGKAPISPETALKLERVFQRPAHFWGGLEMNFQLGKARLQEREKKEGYQAWLKKVPVNAMCKLEWIKRCSNRVEQLDEVLRFFGVSSPEQWEVVWQRHQVAYRQSLRFEGVAEATSAWLRKGELEAAKSECVPYDSKMFQKILGDIVRLTQRPAEEFVSKLEELCASVGVIVLFIHELPKARVSGATRWINDHPVIQLSLRYKTDDQLWFTFFHEAGHILLHGKKEVFVENGIDGQKEDEANEFAGEMLIPKAKYATFLAQGNFSSSSIIRFAKSLGIAPGIVVGRLQHDQHLRYSSTNNKLKKHFVWSVDKANR